MSERSDAIGALYGAMHKLNELGDDYVLLAIICGTLEDLRTKPLPVLTDLAHDADMWADLAAPVELEAYLTELDTVDDYMVKTNHVTLTCITGFKSLAFERAFIGQKLIHRVGKLK